MIECVGAPRNVRLLERGGVIEICPGARLASDDTEQIRSLADDRTVVGAESGGVTEGAILMKEARAIGDIVFRRQSLLSVCLCRAA